MQGSGRLKQPGRSSRRRKRRLRRLSRLAVVCTILALVLGSIVVSRRRHGRPAIAPLRQLLARYPDPPGIVLHSSMSPGKVHGIPIDAERLDQIHADDHPHWATTFEGKVYHIGYHYVILPDGTVQKGRPDHCIGCHAPHYNTWLGICVVGSFDPSVHHHWKPSRPTAAQLTSLIALCERLMSEYHIDPNHVLRHRDTKSTWCPGRRFPYFDVLKRLRAYADLHPETHAPHTAVVAVAPVALTGADIIR